MASDLERLVEQLVATIDTIPGHVEGLHRISQELRRRAGHVVDLSGRSYEGMHVADLLFHAAQRCDDAANRVQPAYTKGRDWAVATVNRAGGAGGSGGTAPVADRPAGSAPDNAAEPLHLSTTDSNDKQLLADPPANSTIVVDGRFSYDIDHLGRVIRARATLDVRDATHPRDKGAQGKVAGKLPGDHGGHLFARIFRGPGDLINLVAMHGAKVNLGEYRRLENKWSSLITRGIPVEVEVEVTYREGEMRPAGFNVVYRAGDKTYPPEFIRNRKPDHKESS